MGPVANNLRRLARTCDWLVLWLDCDREGEAIAYEVIQIAREANPRLDVYRANFSALTHADLTRACLNLARPNPHLAAAVDARQEIDLRIGASFTRYLTLRYKRKLPLLEGILSYGPCQFPTLGFVVQRWLRQRNFIREPFWTINCTICVPVRAAGDDAAQPLIKSDPEDGPTVEVKLHWGRNRLFDHLVTTILYDRCLQHVREFGGGIVTQVSHNPKSRWRPLPLSTVEFAKLASSKLRIDSRQAMRIAEELYNRGIISYPRTETDRFNPTIDLLELVRLQQGSQVWGAFVNELLQGKFTQARRGNHDDGAHPPIHPVQLAGPGSQIPLQGEQWRVYELITRHFLACVAPDAIGAESRIEVAVGDETFPATGLTVVEENWLEVYPYVKWKGSTELPPVVLHQRVRVTELMMSSGMTEPPELLSEAELIDLMDKNHIGTDATMHEHIATIENRGYASRTPGGRFSPSELGVALVQGFGAFQNLHGRDGDFRLHLAAPRLRAQMEADMDL
ncbi:hypothetical protein FOL46_008455, partial [Perkinsus olseni]